MLAPWAAIPPPSRVHVDRVEPGTTTVTQGETLTVSAEVRGLRDGETVRLRYTTADGQEVDAATTMQPAETGFRYEAALPPAMSQSLGLDDDLTYRLEAGDARTIDYKVTVVTAPIIVVRQIDYEYPDYTGYIDQKVENLGDIRGIEGTRVTIHAEANGPIDTAELDFDSDGRSDLRMTSEGTKATASFALALSDDRRTPLHTNYTLRFENQEGRPNLRPAQYKIDVVPDYPPEVELTAPEERVRDVQLNETVVVSVDARDPDFGLTDVSLVGQSTGRAVFEAPLLQAKQPHEGRFTREFRFTPQEHDLKPGDEVEYWATASDTRQPDANVAASSRQTFRIIDPQPKQPDPNALAQRDPPKNQEQQPGEGGQQEQQPGQKGEGEAQQQPGNPGGEQDGESASQPGDAGEGGKGEQGENGDSAEGNQETGGKGGSNAKPSDEPFSREAQSAEPSAQPGENGEQQDGEGQNDGNQGDPGDNSTGEGKQQGQKGEPSGDPQGGEQSADQQQSPVARNGTDDGTAFERINDHLNQENEGGESGEPREGGEQQGEARAKPASGDPASSERSAQQPPDNQPGEKSEGQSRTNEKPGQAGKPDEGERRGEEQPEGQSDQQRPDASEGTGAKTQSGSPDAEKAQQQVEDGQTKSSGGEQQRPRGEAGPGAEKKPQGAPDGEQEVQQREKKPGDPNEKPTGDEQEPPAGSNNEKESDSRGEEGGDHTDGGEEGGGQKAPHEGTGSAGQNQAADEGAGRSADQGPGESTTQPGADAESQQPTGESGEKSPGEGSGSREGTGEQRGGEKGTPPPNGEPGAKPPSEDPFSREAQSSEPNAQPGAESEQPQPQQDSEGQQPGKQGGATGNPMTGGNTGSEAQAAAGGREAEDGDEANLEFARRQTDLALEKLADQLRRKKVDQELLDKLGWSEDDLARFVDRWRERQAAAQRNDPQGEAARQELDQALKSLGLRPRELKGQTERQQDRVRDLRDGPRAPVPIEWQEWMRAYNQGVTRGKQVEKSGR